MDWLKELAKRLLPGAIQYGAGRLQGPGPGGASVGSSSDALGGYGRPSMTPGSRGLGFPAPAATSGSLGAGSISAYDTNPQVSQAAPEGAGRFGFFGDVLGYAKQNPDLVLRLLQMFGDSKAQARDDRFIEDERQRRREEQNRLDRTRRRVASNVRARRGAGSQAPDLSGVFRDPGDPYARQR